MTTRWRLFWLGVLLAAGCAVAAFQLFPHYDSIRRALLVAALSSMIAAIAAPLGWQQRWVRLAGPDRTLVHARGSLSRRMILIATAWIALLLGAGGFALDRILVGAVTRNFDDSMEYVLRSLLVSSEVGPDGEVLSSRDAVADQRFVEPYSGLYYQVSAPGSDTYPSRSLWDRRLAYGDARVAPAVRVYDSDQFPGEKLRIVEQDAKLPGSATRWRFQVAQSRDGLDDQIAVLRKTLVRSFAVLGLGLIVLAALQTLYGLWPLRRVREEIAAMRAGRSDRMRRALPREVAPLVDELNALVAHNERQAEEAREHAGNLAHALKTPLTVIMNAATAHADDLADTVCREATTMRRQVDHHLARARAVGRRGSAHSRAAVWPSVEAVERAVGRLYPQVRLDTTGPRDLAVRVERQDLDEMLGNLVENAAKYGGGSVFVTIARVKVEDGVFAEMLVEDDGAGIPAGERERLFNRGARLDTGKPGTGLGLAIVRDVAEIYGGTVALEESEDLGGLLVRLRLPAAG